MRALQRIALFSALADAECPEPNTGAVFPYIRVLEAFPS